MSLWIRIPQNLLMNPFVIGDMAKKRAKKIEIKMHKKKTYLDHLGDTRVKTAIAIIAILILAVLIAYGGRIFKPKNVVAEINGQKITMDQLNYEYKKIPVSYKSLITKSLYLNQTLIPQTLLVQEADRQGIQVTQADTESFIAMFINQSGLTKEQLETQLKQQDMSYKEFTDFYATRLKIVKLLNQSIGIQEISENEMKKFYDENKASFALNNKTVDYSAVKEQIRSYLASQKQQEKLVEYIDSLRSKARLKVYFENIEEDPAKDSGLSGMQQAESTA